MSGSRLEILNEVYPNELHGLDAFQTHQPHLMKFEMIGPTNCMHRSEKTRTEATANIEVVINIDM